MPTVTPIKRHRPNKDGRHPLQLRVTKGRRSVRINIGKSVLPSEWDDKKKTVTSAHPNKKRLKNYVDGEIVKANNVIFELEAKKPDYTLEMVKKKLTGDRSFETFFSMADEYFDTILKEGKFNRYSGEKAAINHLKRFLNNRDIEFQDLTVQLLQRFKAYLKGELRVSERSAINYLITIRTVFNLGIKEGIVDKVHYPFGRGKISLKRPESQKIGLDESEVKQIEGFRSKAKPFENHARNVWLFSFYFAGMRAADVLTLRWKDFKNDRLYYTMGKNLKSDSLRIPDKAKVILEKYKKDDSKQADLVFPDLSNVENFADKVEVQKKLKYRIRKLDDALKDIATELKIDKPLSMHIARHSFGTIAGDKIPIQKLQKLYRHSSIVTTINYQKAFLHKETDEALDSVLNF